MAPLTWVFTALALALTPTAIAQDVPHFEVDILFPRNATYLATDTFPVAFAIQNLTAAHSLGKFRIGWDFMPFSNGVTPGGIFYGDGFFTVPNSAADDEPVILVDTNNVTEWIVRKNRDETYMLQWSLEWQDGFDGCTGDNNRVVGGNLMFSVVGVEDGKPWADDLSKETPVPADIPLGCPAFSGVFEITPSSTACTVVVKNTDSKGEPCGVKVDKAMASSISSSVSSLAYPPSTSTSAMVQSTSTGGVGAVRPVQTAMAGAACLLSGLSFAYGAA